MNLERLRENLERVRGRMADACQRAGRSADDVSLVAVSKTVTADVARALVMLGVTDLGENRVQEAAHKQEFLAGLDVNWHLIGHLQTNKAKQAARMFDLVHSVDSARVAEALGKRAAAAGGQMPILVQVNVSGEESKFGIATTVAIAEVRRIGELPGIEVQGLMTMAPFVNDPQTVRPHFAALRRLAGQIATLGMAGVTMKHLSMGMTQDYEVAIEEGATLVRIGTALFQGV